MKFKLMPILAIAIALGISTIPVSVYAQPTEKVPSPPSQAVPPIPDLNLTQEQKDQLTQIRLNTRAEMEKVITQEQRDKFQAAIDSGKGRQEAIEAMKLSEAQKNQLQEIVQFSQKQTEAVLTPDQLEQIRQQVRSRLQNLPR